MNIFDVLSVGAIVASTLTDIDWKEVQIVSLIARVSSKVHEDDRRVSRVVDDASKVIAADAYDIT